MADARIDFADGTAYERFMGRWSRAVAPRFLRWIDPPRGARWLDVGCGGGILSEVLVDLYDPAGVVGIDSAAAQIEQASHGAAAAHARFQLADAMQLPFPTASFDIAASALVLNFIPDAARALAEMRRVTRPGGIVAGYVWEFGMELSPSGPLRRAMRAFGAAVPAIPGTGHSGADALRSLFVGAGLQAVELTTIDVSLAYPDFEDFWSAQTPGYAPTTKIINALTEGERRRLKRTVHDVLAAGPNGKIEYSARANAVRAAVPA